MQSKKGAFHLVAKFAALFSWLGVLLVAIYVYMFYGTFSSNAFQSLHDQARGYAEAIAENVDFTGHELIQDESDVNLDAYQHIFDQLILAGSVQPDVTYVYTMRPLDNGDWVFVVDADTPEDENGNGVIDDDEASALPGEVYDVSCCPMLVEALQGPTADEEVTHDQWGEWISGYAPIKDQTGAVVGIVGVDIDAVQYITEIKQLRDLIIRTLALTIILTITFGVFGLLVVNADARRIQKALEIRNEELNALVKKRTRSLELMMSTLVHELRAPLTAVKWGIPSLLELKSGSKDQKVMVDDVMQQTDEMLELVSELLDVSRIELGKFKLEKKQASATAVIKSAVRSFEAAAKEKGLELNIKVERGIPKFSHDSNRLKIVMNNLLSNAIKYTEQGEVNVLVKLKTSEDALYVEVKDSGIGIPKDLQDKVFDPFERGEHTEIIGTGLGLWITKGVIEEHGGTVGVESSKGKGSTFWFELPMK